MTILQNLPQSLEARGLSPESWTLETTSASGLSQQVAQLLETHDRVIVAGGDGTIGQALDGALKAGRRDAAIGFFPLGTGNDMALELKLLRSFRKGGPEALLDAFLKDTTYDIDLWDVNGKAVLANYLSVGLDAAIAQSFAHYRSQSRFKSVTWNKLFYLKAGITSLGTRLGDFQVDLGSDGATSVDLSGSCSVVILNISSYGGGTFRSPGTRPDDGRLSIIPISSIGHYFALAPGSLFAPLARASTRVLLPVWRTDRVQARWTGEIPLQVDGEPRQDLGRGETLDIRWKGQVKILLGPKTPWFARPDA